MVTEVSKRTLIWLATEYSLPAAGTIYSDILGLLVLHVNMSRNRVRDLTRRVGYFEGRP